MVHGWTWMDIPTFLAVSREEAPEAPPLLCHPAQWRLGSTEPQKALEGTDGQVVQAFKH